MEDNGRRITKSGIENASIGAVFNGDAEVKNLIFNIPSKQDREVETVAQLVEFRSRLQGLRMRARFRTACVLVALSLITMAGASFAVQNMPPFGKLVDVLAVLLLFAMFPVGFWMTCPLEWKESFRATKRKVKIISAKIEEVEDRIAHLEIEELAGRR